MIAFAVVDVREARGSSTNVEVLAFVHCLQELLNSGFTAEGVMAC